MTPKTLNPRAPGQLRPLVFVAFSAVFLGLAAGVTAPSLAAEGSPNKPSLQITPAEQAALERDRQVMEAAKKFNAGQKGSVASPFPGAVQVSALMYWSGLKRPDAVAHVKQAILAGEKVNEHDGSGYTALHSAAESGCVENAKVLLAGGADPTLKTTGGKTPADLAKMAGHSEMVALLEAVQKTKRR